MTIISRIQHEQEIDLVKFMEPDSFYWPGFMWLWNDKVLRDELFEQLRDMKEIGARTVWVVPLPRNFRPHSMPTNLEPDYLTEEYIQIYKEFIEEVHRLGMVHWLSDEPGWPSGSMCGGVVQDDLSLVGKMISRQEIKTSIGETIQIPQDALAAFLYQNNQLLKRIDSGLEELIKYEEAVVEIYKPVEIPDHYPDLLKKESTMKFINLTHEAYKKAIGNHFGHTVVAVFNDESKVANPPWTDDLPDDFLRSKGYDIINFLPYLFDNSDDEKHMSVRVDFFDWWTARFAQNYFTPIQDWCNENSLLSIGHLGGEHFTLGAKSHGFGHVLRMLRKLDIPGVDTIWRQLYPHSLERSVDVPVYNRVLTYPDGDGTKNHHFPKYASSVAHQMGKPWAVTESFAIYGSGLTLEQMRWITHYQYVRGLNLMTMSCSYYSTKGHFMAGARPNFKPTNPQWEYMRNFHSYTARLSYLLSLGMPDIETAVYLPIRDIWAGGSGGQEVAQANDELVQKLLDHQCDFDFIDDDILEDELTTAINGELLVGHMKYHTVYVSRSRWMSEKAKRKLADFISQGGNAVYICDQEGPVTPDGSIRVKLSELSPYLRPIINITNGNNPMFKVCKRRLEEGTLYFITNEAAHKGSALIRFNEHLPVYIMDPMHGGCWSPKAAAYAGEGCTIPVALDYADAVVILYTNQAIEVIPEPADVGENILRVDQGWTCRKIKAFRIGENDFEIEDLKHEARIPVELGDWRTRLGEDFSGNASYEVKFECSLEAAEKSAYLDLGLVKYNCEAYLNGVNLGKRAWRPYSYPVSGIVKEGINELIVIVTNTMANQFVTSEVLTKYPVNVTGVYHYIERAFEEQSTASGLYGPVELFGAKERPSR